MDPSGSDLDLLSRKKSPSPPAVAVSHVVRASRSPPNGDGKAEPDAVGGFVRPDPHAPGPGTEPDGDSLALPEAVALAGGGLGEGVGDGVGVGEGLAVGRTVGLTVGDGVGGGGWGVGGGVGGGVGLTVGFGVGLTTVTLAGLTLVSVTLCSPGPEPLTALNE
jgi:hypothetical protein